MGSPRAALILATGVALTAQALLDVGRRGTAAALFLAAATLFAWGARSLAPACAAAATFAPDVIPTRRRLGVAIVVAALVVSLAGAAMFVNAPASPAGWAAYAVSVLLLACGTVGMTVAPPARSDSRPDRVRVAAALFLIVAFGTIVRLYALGDLPFGVWYDEAEGGLAARRLLAGRDFPEPYAGTLHTSVLLTVLYAAATAVIGDTVLALRSVSATFGIAAIGAAFLLGRELHGPRFGLALACITAVARWHVTFSRIAMPGIDAPFFVFLGTYFLLRMSTRGGVRNGFYAGLTLGAGLLMYQGFRLYLLAVSMFACISLAAYRSPRVAWRRHVQSVAMLGPAVFIVTMPLLQVTLRSPGVVFSRASEVSILRHRDEPDLARALRANATSHLLMFNVAGDRNGRHNIPGEPALDPIMGALAVLGCAAAVARARTPANLFFLLLLVAGLAGGILTVDFEAPQSLRAIAAFPAVAYFIALAAVTLGAAIGPSAGAAAPLVVMYAAAINAYDYFGRYAAHDAVWSGFSAAETLVGRRMASGSMGEVAVLSPFLAGHPTIRYLAPHATQQVLQVTDAFPIRDGSGERVSVYLHLDEDGPLAEGRRVYPHAPLAVLAGPPPFDRTPRAYVLALGPADLASVRGLDLMYAPLGAAAADARVRRRRATSVTANWPRDSPITGSFTAEWSGMLYVSQHGTHAIRIEAPARSHVEIDGARVLQGPQGSTAIVMLAQGNHPIRVWAEGAPGRVRLAWTPPGERERAIPPAAFYPREVAAGGLFAAFYPNAGWQGAPVLERIDPVLDTYFHVLPLPRPYSVEWRGSLQVPTTGAYRLGLRAVQDASLHLDDRPVLATGTPDVMSEAAVWLRAGSHRIRVRYRDTTQRSRLHLWWAPPGEPFQPVPRQALEPPQGTEAEAMLLRLKR